ncbi:hypothetical protein A3A74_07710 [Candidatus Roizmanbacteria bacterium RIFCSPLOWO2_01_FULL_35_13]|uniref:O-antigen ligase-related domain-containing protein n=1 Tax=Candidatus Roizmanbacteria bacterium RIFCSPLOWO2_01_FULL_35_13 TaxID=1802055 RepID=A0A1F7I8F6_9BACT|nr:MAG: hypothetical protein A3A74_07710 [Candidatus Roizmanbacteria bacterium RIFCSPLOWO2_01_FULL_35_13]
MIDKILLLFYSLLFFTTPLLMSPFTSELFEFNKLIFIYLITLGVVFIWLLKMILNRKIIIKKTPFDIPILLFFASQIFSTFFSIDAHTSIFGYYGRFNGGLLSIISYIILYYGFVSNLKTPLIKLLKISLFSSLIVIIWGLSGKLGIDFSCLLFVGQIGNNCWTDQFRPAERMFSTLGQPNWLGAYLVINFFIGVFFLLNNVLVNKKTNLNYFVVGFYLLLNFSAILFTRSRSALFAVLFGIGLLLVYGLFKLKVLITKRERNLIGFILLLFFLAVLIFKTGIEKIDRFISFSAYYKATNSNASVESGKPKQSESDSGITTSADIRKIVWKGAIDLGLKYPIFGTGVETFAYSYYFTRPVGHNLTSEWDYLYNKAHNEYLNYLATTGFAGLISYLFFIISVLVYSWKNIKYQIANSKDTNQKSKIEDKSNELLIACLLISYITILITNFFGFSTTTINLFFYLIPAFFFILGEKQSTINNQQSTISKFPLKQKIMFLTILLTVIYLLFGLVRYYLADVKYSKGDNYSKLGDYQKAAQYLTEANNLKYDHVYEDKLSYVYANLAFAASYQKEKGIANKMIQTSDDLNKKSINESPSNVLYWKTRAKNYYLFYQVTLNSKDLEDAIYALQKARTLSSSDPKIPYSLAIFYSLLEEETKDANKKLQFQNLAMREIDQSINLKTDYRDGYFLKGQLLKKTGQSNEAKKTFNFILQNLNPTDSEVQKELESL